MSPSKPGRRLCLTPPFDERLGCEVSREDIADQVAIIRVEHRKSFLNAGRALAVMIGPKQSDMVE